MRFNSLNEVPLELANLLKDAGFPQLYCIFYNSEGLLDVDDNSSDCVGVSAPTHELAMKWLREEKSMLILISYEFESKKWFYDIMFTETGMYLENDTSTDEGNLGNYNSYEDAAEAAIEAACIYLKKQ